MKTAQDRKGLVLSGGGARAAYQVGALRAIAQLLPEDAANPFHIIAGTSAGALNAASIASHAANLRSAVRTLEQVWSNLDSSQVYRQDSRLITSASQWVFSFLANRGKETQTSLLDNSPLENLLSNVIKFENIQSNINSGYLDALAVTASGYSSGESVSFFQGTADKRNWRRPQRIGIRTELTLQHLLASTSIPTLFPAVRINREYFGDGAIRQLAPLSPAIHLGADRILTIGVSANTPIPPDKGSEPTHPSLAKILAHILNSAFVDTLPNDMETLKRINTLLASIRNSDAVAQTGMRHIDLLDIAPSQNLNLIAAEHVGDLPKTMRIFARDAGSSTVLSLLLFEKAYCQRLINLGYEDAMEKETEILEFFRPRPPQSGLLERIRSWGMSTGWPFSQHKLNS